MWEKVCVRERERQNAFETECVRYRICVRERAKKGERKLYEKGMTGKWNIYLTCADSSKTGQFNLITMYVLHFATSKKRGKKEKEGKIGV